ncbi:MAG: VTT domain-containing protein [Oscillospiraceae bacterium]|nr:VTT domain-containing protein [Oscillospiraceae bacterium]
MQYPKNAAVQRVPSPKRGRRLWEFLGVLCVFVAAAVFVLLMLLRADERFPWYTTVREMLARVSDFVRALRPKPLFALAVLAIYAICVWMPVFTLSSLCLISAAVLPAGWALTLNVVGVTILCTLCYYRGEKRGGGKAWRFVLANRSLRSLLERGGAGNPWILGALRMTPVFPVGAVSRLYGAMEYRLGNFLWVTLAGLAPRMTAYIFIGSSVFDPLSPAFLTPIILILLVSGCSLLFWDALMKFAARRSEDQKAKSQDRAAQ